MFFTSNDFMGPSTTFCIGKRSNYDLQLILQSKPTKSIRFECPFPTVLEIRKDCTEYPYHLVIGPWSQCRSLRELGLTSGDCIVGIVQDYGLKPKKKTSSVAENLDLYDDYELKPKTNISKTEDYDMNDKFDVITFDPKIVNSDFDSRNQTDENMDENEFNHNWIYISITVLFIGIGCFGVISFVIYQKMKLRRYQYTLNPNLDMA